MSRRCIALVLVSLLCTIARTRAQAEATEQQPERGPAVERAGEPREKEKKKPPMDNVAIGVLLGVASVGTGDVTNPVYLQESAQLTEEQRETYRVASGGGCTPVDKRCLTPARRGFHLVIPIQVGGAGVSFRFDPYFTFASSARAYGVYTGPNFEFHVIDPLYLGFGFGVKAAWVKADDWKYAADLYGRIPMRATYYVHKDVGLVAEFGFGAGASGYVSELRDVINPVTGAKIARRSAVTFGFGRTWDLNFGVRFP